MKYADLHMHTKASDGLHTPADIVRIAQQAGLSAIAITDHDTTAGVKEAMKEGERLGIEVVPGVEISTSTKGQDIHILGYFIDLDDAQFAQRLEELRQTRNHRNELLIKKLQQLGIEITMEEVLEGVNAAEDESIGRPHFADVLIRKGYVSSLKEAFEVYLGKEGKAYVNSERNEPHHAIKWIKQAGGAVVIAHPGLYADDALVEEIIEQGADGIEVFHADHSADDEARYLKMAEKHQLIVTAGSDFHGERAGIVFHAPVGSRRINVDVIKQLRNARD